MKLFNFKNNKIEEVEQKPFKLEKEIQSLIESNTETIFNLKFIQTELSVDKYRIDSLCYDEENNSFVIIEYKKGSSYSVIDQGYTYLQLLLNNKSDFLLVLSQHFNKVLKMDDIDWSQSRIIFVSPSFNSYQKDSVNFKDLPFDLYEIRRYSNGTIVLNQHHSNSKESIEILSSNEKQSIIKKVSKEVKVYSKEEHYLKSSKEILNRYEELSEKLLELPETEMIPKKLYISLMYHGKTICYIWFKKTRLQIEINRGNINVDGSKSKNYFTLDDPKNISKEGYWNWKSGVKGTIYKINLKNNSDIEYLMFLIKQKYKQLSK